MRMSNLSAARVCGVFLALVVVSFGLTTSVNSAELVYENDFAVRTSAEKHSSVWATYTYDKGGPLAYDFDHTASFNTYTGMYPWQGTASGTVPYSQQDGWFKKNTGSGNRMLNRGRTSVTDEDDPAMIHSAVAVDATHPATNLGIMVQHPLRNVFTNGVIKAQFDLLQPAEYNTKMWSWFRLVTENDMKNNNNSYSQFPLEIGLSSRTISGGWRKAGDPDGTRTFYSLATAELSHWYRFYITCDIDAQSSSLEVYDLGLSRLPMDSAPGSDPLLSRSGLLFRKNIDETTGGICGIAMRFNYVDTEAYYGETGFNESRAYKCDNIKVSWKAPSSQAFEDCYRNDFSKSMRRTIDGSGSTSHAYTLEEGTETATFTYPAELVRALNVGSQTGKPYLPGASNGRGNEVQKAGVDGWRFAGQQGGFSGALALTTNGSNRVGMLTKYIQVLQPMCEDITNGLVKMEWDMRTPKAWNTSYARSSIILTNNRGYDEGYEFAYEYRLLTLGFCSTNGTGNSATPVTTFSVMNSSPTSLITSFNAGWASKFTANEWYRFQLFVDLDKTNYWFRVYDIGAAAPSTPDSFDSSNPANAIVSSVTNGLYNPTSGTNVGKGFTKHGLGIGAYGFVMWNNPDSDAGYAMLVDNVRCWKGDGNDGWDLVFQNDFSTTKRTFTRRSRNLLNTIYIDRPEYGDDGWAAAPTYAGSSRVAGSNPALCSADEIFSLVHPIGRNIRSGKLYAQYDMRIPVFWTSRMDYFWLQFGNGEMASASTWKTPAYRYQNHRTMRTGMQMGKNGSAGLEDTATGVHNRTAIIYQDGTGAGGDGSLKAKHVDGNYVGHWIRVKVEADMSAKTWNCALHDMGTTQPTLATADGTRLDSYDGLHFNFNEPVSYIHIIGGRAPSYMPWRADAPGALMVDNIRIQHVPNGMLLIVK